MQMQREVGRCSICLYTCS